ncbi:hypothetical protein [Mesorhizobium sp. M2A.F.Ca.ET.043.05.1.1]|uniref:hypothetical protein n=1 Tax=Mesorhizobium sp. M2A.F.Ca.ET.043.05.1.1 TaxID=2493671 RepID=UPI001675D15F|nr:hypothetical protein [Mesorhizobium sp. M2A.F.Ca.ET.043.05.1.1]
MRPQKARQPEAVAGRLIGDGDPLDRVPGLVGFVAPALQQLQQCWRIGIELQRPCSRTTEPVLRTVTRIKEADARQDQQQRSRLAEGRVFYGGLPDKRLARPSAVGMCDRKSDIYELYCSAQDLGTSFLVREQGRLWMFVFPNLSLIGAPGGSGLPPSVRHDQKAELFVHLQQRPRLTGRQPLRYWRADRQSK